MRSGLIRRSLTAASATVMAGAMLVVGGAGVASAEPVSAVVETDNTLLNNMRVTRTVSENTVTYGETVTVSSRLERRGGANTNLIYWMRDYTPECFQLVDRATNNDAVTWTPSNGTTYTNGSHPSEVSVTDTQVEVNPPLANSHNPPITMTARYVVTCDAGTVPSGGFQFNGTTSSANLSSMGPSITVQRQGTSVFLRQPGNPEVGQQVTLRVSTTNVPDGGQVAFTVDGQNIGDATVADNQATLPWTPTTEGSKQVQATFAQTGTHGGSVSLTRAVEVSPVNEDSTVSVAASAGAKVGQATQLTATVSPSGAGGTVVFSEEGTSIGTAPVGADGTASIEWFPATAGERTIDADFSGRVGVNPSNGASLVTVAAGDPSDVETRTSLGPIATTPVGDEITLTATVDSGIAGGTVSFYDGQTLIGTAPVQSDGTATLPWTPETDGERTVRAVFSGEGIYLASQATTEAIITPAIVDPEPDPAPTDPSTGSLGSLTGSLGS